MKRLVLTVLVLIVFVPVLWILIGSVLAAREEQAADRAWTEVGLPLDGFAGRFPRQGPSQAALEIESAAANMGIALAPAGATGRLQPAPDDVQKLEAIALPAFVESQVQRSDDAVDVLPEALVRFVTRHAPDIVVIQEACRRPVSWEQDIERLFDAPLPSLKGHRALASVLVLDALERVARGDFAGALAGMDTAWRLNGALRARPELVTQLVAIQIDRLLAGTLRRIPSTGDPWSMRLRQHDYRPSLLTSFQTEGWLLSQYARRASSAGATWIRDGRPDAPGTAFQNYILTPLERPYLRLTAANHSQTIRQAVADLKTADPCAIGTAFDAAVTARIPTWNRLSQAAMPSLSRAWLAAARQALDAELTQKVIEVRVGRAATDDSAWPPALAKAPSDVCPGVSWRYEPSEQGATISVDPDPFGDRAKGLPLRFTARASMRPR